MIYLLDIWNHSDGKCIVPGVHSQGALVRSDSHIPVPNVGELLDFHGDKWRVERRAFFYGSDETKNYETIVKIDLHCSKVS
jgi:hypothetical protein